MSAESVAASYRDPSGFVYRREGVLYRQINHSFRDSFDHFIKSGLYDELVADELLVPHSDADRSLAATDDAYRVIQPRVVPFISYPYEWAFSQLKDAALLTLDIQRRALKRGLVLRDATAYNVQMADGRPVFIDTLSFGRYTEGEPWVGYRQFCQHFLAPLALMARRDVRLGMLHAQFSDGVPLDLASTLLDLRSRANLGLLLHLHLHARAQRKYADRPAESAVQARRARLERPALERLLDHLGSTIAGLSWNPAGSEWAGYEQDNSYTERSLTEKETLVRDFLARVQPRVTWDLGANTGNFSRIAAGLGSRVLAVDGDPGAVELNYLRGKRAGERNVIPLLVDLLNPSPASGWANEERTALRDRGPADAVLALALIHHLTLSGNVPLPKVAAFFAELADSLIIEWVPLQDPQSQRLVVSRREPPHAYTIENFEAAFARHFETLDSRQLEGSERRLYLMARKRTRA